MLFSEFHKIYWKTPVPESLSLIKLQASGMQPYKKTDSGTAVFQ